MIHFKSSTQFKVALVSTYDHDEEYVLGTTDDLEDHESMEARAEVVVELCNELNSMVDVHQIQAVAEILEINFGNTWE